MTSEAEIEQRERLAALAGDVGLALTRSGTLQQVLRSCAEALTRNLDAAFARIWTLNTQTDTLELIASEGLYTHLDGPHSRVPVGKFKIGTIAQERKAHLTNAVVGDPRVSDQEWARRERMVAFAGYPLIVEDQLVGVMALFARHELTPGVLRAMDAISHGIALSIRQKRAEEAARRSEARKSAILDTALDSIITIDLDRRVLEFNPSAERTFGYSHEQAIGRVVEELIIPPHSRGDYLRETEPYLLGEAEGPARGRRMEVAAMRADGSEFPAELAIIRIPIEGSALFTVYLRDITESRRAEAERDRLLARAEAAQRSYQMLAEAIPQQVWTAQPDGSLDYVNQRCADYFMVPQAELLAAGWTDVLHPDDAERCAGIWTRSVGTGESYEVEFRLRRASDGTYRWHLGRAVAMRDVAGRIIRWLGTNTDIHDRKQAEQDLEEAKAAADSANLAKSQFLASMSHELRTPLNAVIGYSEMLQEEAAEMGFPNLIPDLQKIHRAGGYLLTLINNVLDLSKIEAGKMELFLEDFDLCEMIDGVVDTVHPLMQKNGNTVEVSCPRDIGTIRSDLTKLRQCLLNLLSNAAKFTDRGTVRLEVERMQNRILLRVADTGIGLSRAQIARLFEPFAQVHAGRENSQAGTGLGLAITRRLAQMLGGDVSLESEPGKGSVFTISLPADAMVPHPQASRSLGGPRQDIVLMVEDDATARELMIRLFRKEGYETVSVENGLDALRLARELRPAIITLDVIMPEMDGWAVLSALKADPEVCDIPVIMVTILDNQKMGYALGATEYLTKPIDRRRMSAVLAKYRSKREKRQVLVVEDSEPDRTLMHRVLEDAGWAVTEAANGAIGLRMMEQQTPELILLDLLMPEIDGFEFAYTVRRNEKWRSVPIIVTTARDLTAQDRARLKGNVEAVLSKGAYPMDELMREIRDLVVQKV
jgi:PAS domain S-box-containing protein